MCDNPAIEKLKDTFGGAIRVKIPKNPRWRPCYIWDANARIAERAIKSLLPFLLVKRGQAEVALEFTTNIHTTGFYRRKGLTDNDIETRETLRKKIQKLNKRGTSR